MDTSLTYAESLLVAGAGIEHGLLIGLNRLPWLRYCPPTDNDRLRKVAISNARKVQRDYRAAHGYVGNAAMLTPPSAQAKLAKSARYTLGLMLTPARSLDFATYLPAGSRVVNVCPLASLGCTAACLSTSGHGAFDKTQLARQARHGFMLSHPVQAGILMGLEIKAAADKYGQGINLRLNVVSDYRWERIIPKAMAHLNAMGVRLYDYTAYAPSKRYAPKGSGYTLTYSAKESAHTSDVYLADILRGGDNVAMPFQTKGELPKTYTLDGESFTVINGDLSDDRTLDPRGVIVGLTVKGNAGKRDDSGFIRLLQGV